MIDAYHPVGDRLMRVDNCMTAGIDPGAVWIDLLRPDKAEERLAEQFIGAELPTKEEMEEIEPSSRLGMEDGVLYLTAALVCRSESSEPRTTAVTFVLTDNHLATVRYDEPGTMPLAVARITKPGASVSTAPAALILLLEAAIDRLADIVERTGARIEAIARHIFEADGERASRDRDFNVALRNVGREGMRLGILGESLISLSRLLLYLTEKAEAPRFGKDDRARMKTMSRDVTALGEYVHALEDRVTFLLDATLGLISIQQNDIIKIFSVLAVVFMPPTLVASIYGMNFDVMPELHWRLGYPWALLVMVAAAVGTYALFRWRRWL